LRQSSKCNRGAVTTSLRYLPSGEMAVYAAAGDLTIVALNAADDRLRDLVQRTGDLTIATDLGVPRSTARGWLRAAPRVVVTVDLAYLTAPELRQEIQKLRRRVRCQQRTSGEGP
jgi:hypothetical protein